MQKWEYLFCVFSMLHIYFPDSTTISAIANGVVIDGVNSKDFKIHDYLNSLGKEGWELVDAETTISQTSSSNTTTRTYYFKRPIE